MPAAIVKALGIIVLSGESADQAAERFLAAKHLLLVADNFEHAAGGRAVHRPAARGLSRAHRPRHQSRTARACRPRSATRCRRSRCPSAGRPRTRRRWPTRTPSRCSASARAPTTPTSTSTTPTPPRSRRSAGASTGCRWRSSSRPPAAGCCRPTEIAERLETALGALGAGARDAPARQQTLRATIDWSHELLSDAEKQCFARFAVFAGGATVEAAETITAAGLDTLDGLVAKSLLVRRQHAHAPTRLGMLETIRAYAGERFAAAADAEAVRERHYRYYLALAERHGTERALWGAGAREHLARLDAEIDNLHAALGWAVAQAERRTGARDGGSARLLLGHAKPLRRRRGLDRPGAEPAGRRRPSGPARPRSAARRPGACGSWGAEPSSPRSWPRRRPSPDGSAIP